MQKLLFILLFIGFSKSAFAEDHETFWLVYKNKKLITQLSVHSNITGPQVTFQSDSLSANDSLIVFYVPDTWEGREKIYLSIYDDKNKLILQVEKDGVYTPLPVSFNTFLQNITEGYKGNFKINFKVVYQDGRGYDFNLFELKII